MSVKAVRRDRDDRGFGRGKAEMPGRLRIHWIRSTVITGIISTGSQAMETKDGL